MTSKEAAQDALRDWQELKRGKFEHQKGTGQGNGHQDGQGSAGAQGPSRGHDEAQPERRLFLTTFEDIDERPLEPMHYLVKPHLPAGEATMLFAPPRNFKSFLTMEWALAVALGRPFLDRYEAERGLVFYLDLENCLDRLRERIKASLARDGYHTSDLAGRLLLQDRGKDIPPWRMDAEALAQLSETVRDFAPRLVIVDNFRKALPPGLSENKNDEVNPLLNQLIAVCEQVDAAFLLVHHTNRGYENFSGAGSLESTMANVVKIQREAQSAVATVSCVNMRNAEDWDPFGIAMGPDGALQLTEPQSSQQARDEDRLVEILARGAQSVAQLAKQSGLSEYQVRDRLEGLRRKGLVIALGTRVPGQAGGKPAQVFGLASD